MLTDTKGSMPLAQLINMLTAAYAQGARSVMVARPVPGADGTAAPIDWVSMAPVNNVVYVGTMGEWEPMGNEALESLDW